MDIVSWINPLYSIFNKCIYLLFACFPGTGEQEIEDKKTSSRYNPSGYCRPVQLLRSCDVGWALWLSQKHCFHLLPPKGVLNFQIFNKSTSQLVCRSVSLGRELGVNTRNWTFKTTSIHMLLLPEQSISRSKAAPL